MALSTCRRSLPEIYQINYAWAKVFQQGFEAEDVDLIEPVYIVSHPEDLLNPDRESLHKILYQTWKLGRGPHEPSRGCQHFHISERRDSFKTGAWHGPPAADVAECGLFRISENAARCYCCLVTFRSLTRDMCIWTRHRMFSPFCCHLKRARRHGHKAKGVVTFVRHFSTSDSMGLE